MALSSFLDLFRGTPKNSASVARERLQIIVSHERRNRNGPNYLPTLQREILDVIAKYVHVERDQVKVDLSRSGDCSVLELNVTLPD